MTQNIPLPAGALAIAPFFAATQEMLGAAAPSLNITVLNATTVQVVAAAADGVQAVSMQSRYRYRTTSTSAAHPGGAAGVYNIFITGSDNSFAGSPTVDSTVYDFGLVVLAVGSNPVTALYRKVGEVDWDGTKIIGIRNMAGARHDEAPLTPTAPIAGLTPVRVKGAAGQTAALQTWENSAGVAQAQIDPTGRLSANGFSSASVWSPGDLKISMQTADHGLRADGTFDWVLVSPGRRLNGTNYAALRTALGNPALDGGNTYALPAIGDQALVAAGTLHTFGTAWGQENVALTGDQLAAHYHGGTTGNDSPDHSHSVIGGTGGQSADHGHSGTTAAADAQGFRLAGPNDGATIASAQLSGTATGSAGIWVPRILSGATWGGWGTNHSHTFSTGGTSNDHSHAISFQSGNASARHQHTFTTNNGNSAATNNALAGQAHPNTQPSFAVNVFIKA